MIESMVVMDVKDKVLFISEDSIDMQSLNTAWNTVLKPGGCVGVVIIKEGAKISLMGKEEIREFLIKDV
jgi:hypothetical protein